MNYQRTAPGEGEDSHLQTGGPHGRSWCARMQKIRGGNQTSNDSNNGSEEAEDILKADEGGIHREERMSSKDRDVETRGLKESR